MFSIELEKFEKENKSDSVIKHLILVDIGQSRNKDSITPMLMIGNESFHLDSQNLITHFKKILKPGFILYL